MIGIVTEETTTYDMLSNFSVKLNDEKRVVEIYHKDKYLGILSNVIGIDEDEFVNFYVRK